MNETLSGVRGRLSEKYTKGETEAMIRIIFRNIMHYEPVDILLRKDSVLPGFIVRKIHKVVDELMKNRPIQYIFGQTYFCGHVFRVDESTLIPRPETEELVDMVADENPEADLDVLDAGTGSGCIAVSLAKAMRFPRVVGIDMSERALEVARLNASRLRAAVDFRRCDMLALPPSDNALYDVVVSNPPYVAESEKMEMEPSVLDYEPPEALFVPDSDPLVYYRALAAYGVHALKPGGRIYFEINSRFPGEMRELLAGLGYEDVDIRLDIRRMPRFAVGRKGGEE